MDIYQKGISYLFLGILVSFLANYCLADVEGGWRVMFGISAVAAIIQAIAMIFLPKVCRSGHKIELVTTILKLLFTFQRYRDLYFNLKFSDTSFFDDF